MRHLIQLVLVVCPVGCGGSPPATTPAVYNDVARSSVDEPGNNCASARGDAALPAFIAPVGGDAFRVGLSQQAQALRCCLPSGGPALRFRISIDGVENQFTDAPDEVSPRERECLDRELALWTISPILSDSIGADGTERGGRLNMPIVVH